MTWKEISGIGLLALCGCRAPSSAPPKSTPAAAQGDVQLLFVQDADGVQFGDGTMTLRGVRPNTLYFSDRPARIAGYVKLENFLLQVAKERAFHDSPPNAVLVMLEDESLDDIVMELTARPTLDGNDLKFQVRVLEGKPPESAGSCSLFVDSVGERDVWTEPETMPRDYDQPQQVGDDQRQPKEIGPNDRGPDESVDAVDFHAPAFGRWRRGYFDPKGPFDARGQPRDASGQPVKK